MEIKVKAPTPELKTQAKDAFYSKMEQMFEHKSKLSKMVDPQFIKNYKEAYFYILDKLTTGKLPTHSDYFGGNVLAKSIFEKKYYLKDADNKTIEKRPEDVYLRLAAYQAAVETNPKKREEYAEKFYLDLFNGYYLPGGRVIAGSGDLYRIKTLANCFVSVIGEDNLEGIYKAAYEAARTYSYGGGIGVDISQLRPKGAVVHNAADSSTGAVSFMELYSLTTGLIGQSGRRGALMLTVDVKHPDVLDFIKVKKDPNWVTNQIIDRLKWTGIYNAEQLEKAQQYVIENTQVRFANISIKVSDEFMQAVEEQNKFGKEKLIVYKKVTPIKGPQPFISADEYNYSYGISWKNLKEYELVGAFSSLDELNKFLAEQQFSVVTEEQLADVKQRDYYGDVVLSSPKQAFDVAIHYSGDFLTTYKSKNVGEVRRMYKARDIWNAFIEGNYKTAEPGLIFWSQMSKYSPSNYVGRPIACTNPCGEVPLEDGGACNLGSVNLSRMVKDGYSGAARVDWDLLKQTTTNLMRFLDNVVWWNETLNALDKQRDAAKITRRLGLGVMGIADMCNQLGIGYDSEEGIKLLEQVMDTIAQTAYAASAYIAREKGPAPCFNYAQYSLNPFFKEVIHDDVKALVRQYGLRNIAILSIAPTGTISNGIIGYQHEGKNYMGISGGIEPIFALYYTRRSETLEKGKDTYFKVFHSTVQAYIDVKGLADQVQSTSDESDLRKLIPDYFFRTAHYISPEMRVKIQGIAQKYVDHSISSTVNLAEDIDPETVSDIYLNAWKHGLKGITVYRDGSRYPILSVEGKETDFQRFKKKSFKVKDGDKELVVKGDEVLVTASGRLTTMYHAKAKGLF